MDIQTIHYFICQLAYSHKEENMKKIFSFCLVFALIVPAIFLLSACGGKKPPKTPDNTTETVKVYEGFVFDGTQMTGYVGDDTEIIIPSSYSIHNTESDVHTIEYNIKDIINYGDESSLDYEIWAEDISDFDRFMLVGGMYNVSVNGGEKQYIRVGEAEEYFTTVKDTYTDPNTTIAIELTDYVLTPEDAIDESNFTVIMRPIIEIAAGQLESFSMTYNSQTVNFTKENYVENMGILMGIVGAGPLTGDLTYDIGNYIEFVEGDDFKVESISSLSPDQALGGGLFATPKLTSITIPASITTIVDGVFAGVTTMSDVVIESAEIYNSLTDTTACGSLIANTTNIKVSKNIVDSADNTNEFLNISGGYTKSQVGDYYVYTK